MPLQSSKGSLINDWAYCVCNSTFRRGAGLRELPRSPDLVPG